MSNASWQDGQVCKNEVTSMKSKIAFLILLAAILWLGALSDQAAAAFVDGPGPVLVIDGTDADYGVGTFNIDATLPVSSYDFGFVESGMFIPIALLPSGPASLFGTYEFVGGSLINFALRYNPSGTIYTIVDPADYANQVYLNPIDPSHSSNPAVTFTYYNKLVLEWDLDGNGFNPFHDAGFTITKALHDYDGMAPAPVPIPASILLFITGLAGLAGIGRRKLFA
jgi:hypothetical protein